MSCTKLVFWFWFTKQIFISSIQVDANDVSFLWLNNSPLCICSTFSICIHQISGHLGCFQFLTIMNSALLNMEVQMFLWHTDSISFVYTYTCTHLLSLFLCLPFFLGWGVILLRFWFTVLWWIVKVRIFSSVVCHLLRNVYVILILNMRSFDFYYWNFGVPYILGVIAICQIYC